MNYCLHVLLSDLLYSTYNMYMYVPHNVQKKNTKCHKSQKRIYFNLVFLSMLCHFICIYYYILSLTFILLYKLYYIISLQDSITFLRKFLLKHFVIFLYSSTKLLFFFIISFFVFNILFKKIKRK